MNADSVWLDGHTITFNNAGHWTGHAEIKALAPYLPDRPGAPPIPCVYHGQIDGQDVWEVIGGGGPGRAGSLDKDVWEVALMAVLDEWDAAGTCYGSAYFARRRQPPKVTTEATYNKRREDGWTVDVLVGHKVACSVPASGKDDADALRMAEDIAAAVRAQMGGAK